jgi:hypothetical protein
MRVEHQEDLMGKVRTMITSARASYRMVRSARLLYLRKRTNAIFLKPPARVFPFSSFQAGAVKSSLSEAGAALLSVKGENP